MTGCIRRYKRMTIKFLGLEIPHLVVADCKSASAGFAPQQTMWENEKCRHSEYPGWRQKSDFVLSDRITS